MLPGIEFLSFLDCTITAQQIGFITWTTFTNWQVSFEWNSLHPRAFEDYADGDYKDNLRDDGTFSAELQNR